MSIGTGGTFLEPLNPDGKVPDHHCISDWVWGCLSLFPPSAFHCVDLSGKSASELWLF